MSNWKTVRLGDVCDTISATYKKGSKSVVLINTSDVLSGKVLNHKKEPNENLKGQFKKTFQRDDVLYSEIRPQNRRFAFIDFEPTDYIASTKLMVLRCKECILPKYLFQILSSDEIIQNLQALAETRSGTFPQITFSELSTIEIQLPSLAEQGRIAGILGALDDKIECNNRINRNLEEQAAVLFRRWFVDFEFPDPDPDPTSPTYGKPYRSAGGKMQDSPLGSIPKGWQVGTLGEIATITMGQSPAGTSYNEEGNGEVFYQGRAEFGDRFPKRRLFTTEPNRMADENSILMSVRAPVGDINIAYEKCCIGRGLASIKATNNFNSFVLYTMYSLKDSLNVFNGEGTVFGSINKDSLREMKTIIPYKELITKFELIVSAMDSQIKTNFFENQSLATLRNTLLPKLMNNQIKI